jgi:hypothetical protein
LAQQNQRKPKKRQCWQSFFLKAVNAKEVHQENQLRYEAIKVVSIEAHQGRAYNSDTMSRAEADIDLRNGCRSNSNDSI